MRRLARRQAVVCQAALALCVAGAVGRSVRAQTPTTSGLAPATAELREEFSVIAAVRELADGRVLVSDEKDGRLLLADFASGAVVPVGRRGAGPGEYRQLGRIWPLAGDSTLVKEPFSPRWILLSGGRIAATFGPGEPGTLTVGPFPLVGTDARGRVVWAQFARDANGRPAMNDSLFLLRLDRTTQRVDTIARLQDGNGWERANGVIDAAPAAAAAGSGAPRRRMYRLSLMAPDQVAVFPDGWIAIARSAPYRVDWCAPGRRCVAGPTLGPSGIPMTDREKRAYLATAQATQSWPPTTEVEETSGWPTLVPPFATPTSRIDASAVLPLPDGRLLVERLPTADAPGRRYDVVARAGGIVRQLRLDLSERIVGASARHLYVAAMDADGIQRLRRHPLP